MMEVSNALISSASTAYPAEFAVTFEWKQQYKHAARHSASIFVAAHNDLWLEADDKATMANEESFVEELVTNYNRGTIGDYFLIEAIMDDDNNDKFQDHHHLLVSSNHHLLSLSSAEWFDGFSSLSACASQGTDSCATWYDSLTAPLYSSNESADEEAVALVTFRRINDKEFANHDRNEPQVAVRRLKKSLKSSDSSESSKEASKASESEDASKQADADLAKGKAAAADDQAQGEEAAAEDKAKGNDAKAAADKAQAQAEAAADEAAGKAEAASDKAHAALEEGGGGGTKTKKKSKTRRFLSFLLVVVLVFVLVIIIWAAYTFWKRSQEGYRPVE